MHMLNKYIAQHWAKWQHLGIALPCPRVAWNNRIYRCAGRYIVEDNIIEISSKLYNASQRNADELMTVILPHEMAHYIDVHTNGIPKGNRWHGRNWQNLMVRFGLEPNPYHSLEL